MGDWQSHDGLEIAQAERFLRLHPTLHDLLRAGGEVVDVVVQDEFTHDVVARIVGGPSTMLAVFDST